MKLSGYQTIYIERATEIPSEPEDARTPEEWSHEFDLVVRERPGAEQGGLFELASLLNSITS